MLLATVALASEQAATLLCDEAIAAGWSQVGEAVIAPANPLDYKVDPAALGQFSRLVEAIQAKGVQVAVVLVPERGHTLLAPEPGTPVPKEWARDEAAYVGLVHHFRSLGALAPDVSAVAAELRANGCQFFRPDDGHWSPDGARATAAALAGELAEQGNPSFVGTREGQLDVRPDRKHAAGGYARKVDELCGTTLPRYRGPSFSLQVAPAGSEALLADEPPPPVVVVGSSFAREPFGFGPALSAELDADILSIGVPGGRVRSGMETWLSTADLDAAPPELVVWVLTMHHLLAPTEPLQPTLHGATALRLLRPMVDGGCDAAHEVARLDTRDPLHLYDATSTPLPSVGHYLQIEGPDIVHRSLEVTLRYGDGTEEALRVAADGRVRGHDYLAVEFNPFARAGVVSIGLAARGDGALGEFSARACRLDKP